MQPYDALMLGVLGLTTLLGAWRGMAWQIASLASIGLSYLTAVKFSGQFAPMFGDEAPWNRFAAMLALYLGTSMAVWLGFRVVSGMIDRVKLKEFDRQLGAVFGAAKGVLFCLVITFFAVTLSAVGRDQVLKSRSGTYIAQLIDRGGPMLPREVHDVLAPYLEQLDKELDPAYQPATGTADLESLAPWDHLPSR